MGAAEEGGLALVLQASSLWVQRVHGHAADRVLLGVHDGLLTSGPTKHRPAPYSESDSRGVQSGPASRLPRLFATGAIEAAVGRTGTTRTFELTLERLSC